MTQAFGALLKHCVFHISDRLLSQETTNGYKEFDRNSNKAVIYQATDAHVVVTYTGRAYIDNIPTDTFIAQNLIEQDLSGSGAFVPVGRNTWTDIGRSVERLRISLIEAYKKLPIRGQSDILNISILGWRQKRSKLIRVAPINWQIYQPTGPETGDFQIHRHYRWFNWNKQFVLQPTPNAPEAILDWMVVHLREHGYKSPDAVKQILINGLNRCAIARPDTVGTAGIQIHLAPTMSPQARIRFIADIANPNNLPNDVCGYSPWIIAPPMAFSPAKIRGDTTGGGYSINPYGLVTFSPGPVNSYIPTHIRVDKSPSNYTWTYEGPLGAHNLRRIFHSSQPRPRDPQQRT